MKNRKREIGKKKKIRIKTEKQNEKENERGEGMVCAIYHQIDEIVQKFL